MEVRISMRVGVGPYLYTAILTIESEDGQRLNGSKWFKSKEISLFVDRGL